MNQFPPLTPDNLGPRRYVDPAVLDRPIEGPRCEAGMSWRRLLGEAVFIIVVVPLLVWGALVALP